MSMSSETLFPSSATRERTARTWLVLWERTFLTNQRSMVCRASHSSHTLESVDSEEPDFSLLSPSLFVLSQQMESENVGDRGAPEIVGERGALQLI